MHKLVSNQIQKANYNNTLLVILVNKILNTIMIRNSHTQILCLQQIL